MMGSNSQSTFSNANNSITSIFDNLFDYVEKYDLEVITSDQVDINIDNISILGCVIKNYYKVKLQTLLGQINNSENKINMLNKFLPLIFDKITLLNMDQIYKNKITQFIIKDIENNVEEINKTLAPNLIEKNILQTYSTYKKIYDLEKNMLKFNPYINISISKQYEIIMLEKILKIFRDLSGELTKDLEFPVYKKIDETNILESYWKMSMNIANVQNQLNQIDIMSVDIVKNFVQIQIIDLYVQYFSFVDNDILDIESNYLFLNTLGKIIEDIKILDLNSINVTEKYLCKYKKILYSISNYIFLNIVPIIKLNINNKKIINCSIQIIDILKSVICKLNTPTLNDLLDDLIIKISDELINIFIDELSETISFYEPNSLNQSVQSVQTSPHNQSNLSNFSDNKIDCKSIIDFDIFIGEFSEELKQLYLENNLKINIINESFDKIKLIRNYYTLGINNEDIIKDEFIKIYGNLDFYEKILQKHKHKTHRFDKIQKKFANMTFHNKINYSNQLKKVMDFIKKP
jgi:hypothetical protein